VISGRLGYNPMGTVFSKTDSGNKLSNMDASLGYLEISPMVQFHNLLPTKEIYFLAGLEFGIPVSSTYKYSVSNQNLVVLGNIPSPSASVRLALGMGYMYKLTDKIWLTPELTLRFPFGNVSGDVHFTTWSTTQIRLGVSLLYSFEKDNKDTKEPVKSYDLKLGFKEVRYYNNEGNYYPVKSVKVEDVQYTELYPFIPYVFCEENQPKPLETDQNLAGRMESGEFNINKLEADAMKINQSTIDIIGIRMKENPKSELTITGTNDGKTEKGSNQLSLKRAEFAKQYLVDNYGINPELINVRGSNLPARPSTSNVPDGIAENRRIEFTSSDKNLFKPIVIENENQRIADPSLIEFVPYTETKDSISAWNMEISQSDKTLRKNSGTGIPPAMQWGIRPNELTNKQIPIDYTLTAKTVNGIEKSAAGSIPTEYYSSSRKKTDDMPDKIISKYSLILFDFDKADISDADKEIVIKNIIPAIKFNSTVKIFGYTDRIGDEKYNRNLAKRRAEAVRDVIQDKMKDVKIEVYGVGDSVPIFNNDSPIGRQLSRTVQVSVVTPK